MPVKLRITILFTIISMLVLALVCGSIYYIASANRVTSIKTRLVNRAITTARLLSQSETFNRDVISKIDALTASALKNKTVQAYNAANARIYSFSDSFADTIHVKPSVLQAAITNSPQYFTSGPQDAVGYYYTENNNRIVIISAAYDELGKNNLRDLLFILVISSIGGVIISFISGYFFSGRLLSPVKNIADKVNEISAQNLATRLASGNVKDEWFYLADTLNRLLDRLQDSFESQRRFISNASHELSTPLTAISSQLEVYLQKERSVDEYRKVMGSIYQDVQHLSELTKTLLEFAKTSGNAGGIELNYFRVDETLLKLPAEISKVGQGYSVDLSFSDLPDDEQLLVVFGSEELLFTAIRNIVLNACKYSPDKQANVSLSVSGRRVVIAISDRGPGIHEDEISRIFEPFYRSESRRKTEGFGLGLSLALRILKLHKGEINVRSSEQGSTFFLEIPSSGDRGQH